MKKSLGARTAVVPTPTVVVCVYDAAGKPNGATVAWGGMCGSKPPCLTVSLRAATYTHGCILARKAFTVNVPPVALAKQVDYFGIASGRNVDKFKVAGFTAVKGDHVDAPYIAEFPLIAECRLIQTLEMGIHTMFIGEILDVKADSEDIAVIRPFVYCSIDKTYWALGDKIGPAFSIGKSVGQ